MILDWYCPTYHCRMTKMACDLRKSKAKTANYRAENNYRISGCATCAKGEPILTEEKPIEKKCNLCGKTKPLSEFHKHSDCKYGVDNRCKVCKNETSKAAYHRSVEAAGKPYPETPEIITGEIIFSNPEQEERGPKETTGKPDWAVFPFAEAEEVVRVFEYGANKYGAPFTYRKGIPQSELWSATMRHMIAIQSGESFDTESGCLHTAHIAANALMMLSEGQ